MTASFLRTLCATLGAGALTIAGPTDRPLQNGRTIGPPSDSLVATVDRLVRDQMAEASIPGAAVVLVVNGQVVMARGFGVADRAQGTPVSVDSTIFRIGSVSKFLTFLGLLRLIDEGRLTLDTPVASVTDLPDSLVHGVLIRHLLTHTAGFDQVGTDRQVGSAAKRPGLRTWLAGHLRPLRKPGTLAVYDTYGATLAGAVIEAVSGRPYCAVHA